jgi:GNAT superfamily N-acetyltransferase
MIGPRLANIRVAEEGDIAAMHRVRVSVRENQLTNPAVLQPDHYRDMLRQRGRGWVAEVDGCIVAFAVADRARFNVWALFVDPAYEGLGLGRKLQDEALAWLFAEGAERVWLSTTPGTRADRFYRTSGWLDLGAADDGEIRFEISREAWLSRAPSRGPVTGR